MLKQMSSRAGMKEEWLLQGCQDYGRRELLACVAVKAAICLSIIRNCTATGFALGINLVCSVLIYVCSSAKGEPLFLLSVVCR